MVDGLFRGCNGCGLCFRFLRAFGKCGDNPGVVGLRYGQRGGRLLRRYLCDNARVVFVFKVGSATEQAGRQRAEQSHLPEDRKRGKHYLVSGGAGSVSPLSFNEAPCPTAKAERAVAKLTASNGAPRHTATPSKPISASTPTPHSTRPRSTDELSAPVSIVARTWVTAPRRMGRRRTISRST